jgi:TolA-binding protein
VGADLDRSTAVRPGDEDLILAAADRALQRVLGAPAAARLLPRSAEVRASSRRHARRIAAALVAAAMISASGMAAAWWSGVVAIPWLPTPTRGEAATPAAAPVVRHRAHTPKTAKAEAGETSMDPAPPETAAPEQAVVAAEPEARMARAEPLAPRAAPRPSKNIEPAAPELFSRANAARRAGDFAQARRVYSELIAKYPDSDEARLSELSLGKLLLASGEAAQAEREFSHYLSAGNEPLAEEALVNQAESLHAMNRAADERKAWQRLLMEHPNSVYGARARARLSALARER